MRSRLTFREITPGNGAMRYFHADANGNYILQTNSSGSITEQYDYDASGNNIGYSPYGNRFLFIGREWLSDVRLYDLRNRMYQPELGRFLQPDPKQFAAGDYNLYRYCHNDPVNHTDPTGLVDLSLTPYDETPNNAAVHNWEDSYNPSDRFTLAGHGNWQFFLGPDGGHLSATQVAQQMVGNGFTGDKKGELVVCRSGRGENSMAEKIAQKLANLLNKEVTVRAPTTEVGNGTKLGGDPTLQRMEDPNHPNVDDPKHYLPDKPENQGKWREFTKRPQSENSKKH